MSANAQQVQRGCVGTSPKLLNPNKPKDRAFPVIKFHDFEYDGYIASGLKNF